MAVTADVGTVLSLIVAVVGAVYAWRNWSGGSALSEPGAMRRYGIIVGVEFGVAGAGAAVIAHWGRGGYIAAWVSLVVGVHFWLMAPVLKSPSLVALGALLTVDAVAAVLVSRRAGVAPSPVAGAGAGVALLGFAGWVPQGFEPALAGGRPMQARRALASRSHNSWRRR